MCSLEVWCNFGLKFLNDLKRLELLNTKMESSLSGTEDDEFAKTLKRTLGSVKRNVMDQIVPKYLESDEQKVCVAVRVRPLNKIELENGCSDIVTVDQSANKISLRRPSAPLTKSTEPKSFVFDAVFPPITQQADLYNQVARPIVQNVIQGYNGTIFAYGQTGTGKTFTMEGERTSAELKGIIPNSFAQIFSHISRETGTSKFLVRVTFLEIYNEEIRDLLIGKETPKKCEIKESETGVYVKNLCSFVVKSEKDMDRILAVGKRSRAVAATNMNAESSRSHSIFTVTVECSTEDANRQSFRMGKLNLVDLAGSERASKSGATGIRLKEGAKINLSLSCLGNVISALVDGKAHIPYRESKLTRLLQDSLGGNAKTVMIANIGPADDNYEETLSTLRYADRAKRITNHAHINEDPKDAILRQFENEIEALKKQLEDEDLKLQKVIQQHEEGAEADYDKDESDEETLVDIKGELENQQRLSTTVQAETAHKHSTLIRLKDDVVTWKQQQEKKAELQQKLAAIQKKIMVGGESLLDKSQEQEAYLQRCMNELEQRREEQSKLQTSLTCKMAEKIASEEYVMYLQEEHERLEKETKKWYKILKREQLADEISAEDERAEKESLESEIRKLNFTISKNRAIIEKYIPNEALNLIQNNMTNNSELSSWNLRFKDFTGNNLNLAQTYCQGPRNYTKKKDLSRFYRKLPDEGQMLGHEHPHVGFEEVDPYGYGSIINYTSIQPVRTQDLLTSEESLKLLKEHDLLDPPTFHFMTFDTPLAEDKDIELFSKRIPPPSRCGTKRDGDKTKTF